LCVITIKLNTLTDVPYQLFTYVKTWERGGVNNEQWSRVYYAVRYKAFFFARRLRYNGVAVYT